MRLSLRTKTIAGTAIIEATLLVVLIVTSLSFINSLTEDSVLKRTSTTTNLFASTTKDALLTLDLASLEASVQELMTNPDIAYVRVIDNQQRILAVSGDTSSLSSGFTADTTLANVNDGVFDSNRRIVVSGHYYGEIQLGIDIGYVQSSLIQIRNWIVSLALIELGLVALFSYGLGTYLTSQLNTLRQGAKDIVNAIKTSNFNTAPIAEKGHDELTELAKTFNLLVKNLETEYQSRLEAENELTQLNQSLEEKIARRTQALSEKNELLEQSNKELKETQQQLFQAEKMASVGQLAAGVAHEINNPVGFVSSNLNTLTDYLSMFQILMTLVKKLQPDADIEAQKALITEIHQFYAQHDFDFISEDVTPLIEESVEGLARVSEIVKGLKVFSRIDSDEKQWFDLNHCLNTTLTMVNNKLKYICKVEKQFADLPRVYFNVGKLTQVFTNLLINAGQAIEATGKQGVITVHTYLQGKQVIVDITDTGCGISEENLEKLFNPFFTTKPEGQGTGLGLSITYGIIQEHGGSIEVTSKEGEGSRFIITLPVGDNSQPLQTQTSEAQ
ncbi:HAMP domain-containing protein [Marisediminitalea aggregata]|uniref:histidine kinase n=1 Tax=Marisediminitalea aggregata TaxID=634436 RepID=A0A1M5HZW5_9ALTE|nr:ATP-binding protein [Marisediminitalea aggregata]SHG21432.1 HAMP domain-containing protein [Marisediminitalea aggregata]